MRSLILAVFVMFTPVLSMAQDTIALPHKTVEAAAPAVVAAPVPVAADAPTPEVVENPEATPDTVVQDAVAAAEEASKLKAGLTSAEGRTAKLMVIASFLAALIKLLLSLVKVLAKNVSWFAGKEGKRIVKYSTLGLGALTGLVANLGFGLPLVESLLIALSGPLSVAIHEYTKDSKDPVKVA
jgi:hypothetical protein